MQSYNPAIPECTFSLQCIWSSLVATFFVNFFSMEQKALNHLSVKTK